MARDPDEKARFRGNDKAYAEGWDRIFGKKEQPKEEATEGEKEENETKSN